MLDGVLSFKDNGMKGGREDESPTFVGYLFLTHCSVCLVSCSIFLVNGTVLLLQGDVLTNTQSAYGLWGLK